LLLDIITSVRSTEPCAKVKLHEQAVDATNPSSREATTFLYIVCVPRSTLTLQLLVVFLGRGGGSRVTLPFSCEDGIRLEKTQSSDNVFYPGANARLDVVKTTLDIALFRLEIDKGVNYAGVCFEINGRVNGM
jgi:hypothetical protein